jgi:hypothetical protein
MQQDELTRLFSASMNLSQTTAPPTYQQALQDPPVQEQQEQEQEQAPKQIVYASQHYTHSHHVAPRSASEPPLKTHIDPSHLADVLLRNSIDPCSPFPFPG